MLSSTFCLFQLENYLNSGNPRWRYQVELIKFRFAPLCCALFVNKLNTQSYMFSLPHATSPCIFALWFIAHKAPPSCPFPCTNSLLFPVPPSCLYFLLFCCPTPRCSWASNFLHSVRDPEQRCNTVIHVQATYSAILHFHIRIMCLSRRLTVDTHNPLQVPIIRVVTKISSCQANTKSRRRIKQLGVSFLSIFLPFSFESSRGPRS